MNNKYTITVGSPLLRPGLTITTEVSERYLVDAVRTLMGAIREINEEVGGKPSTGSRSLAYPQDRRIMNADDARVKMGLRPHQSGTPADPWMRPQDHERPGDPE